MAFFQEQWDKVITRFANASFGKWNPPEEVTLGSSVIKAQPYLDMLAVAISRLNSPTPVQVLKLLESVFGVSEKQWDTFRLRPAHPESKSVAKLKARCRPRLGAAEALSVDEALRRGNTARARHVLTHPQQADKNLESAQRAVETFAKTGEETELERFVSLVVGSGIASISHSFLFAALGHDSFPGNDDAGRPTRASFQFSPRDGQAPSGKTVGLEVQEQTAAHSFRRSDGHLSNAGLP